VAPALIKEAEVAAHIGALGAVAQRMVHHHQRQHGLGDRRGADAHAGVVAALGDHLGGRPARSIDSRGVRMELVGLMAMLTSRSCPVLMPPSTPPALLLAKPRA
jgi:hypothetical protein